MFGDLVHVVVRLLEIDVENNRAVVLPSDSADDGASISIPLEDIKIIPKTDEQIEAEFRPLAGELTAA